MLNNLDLEKKFKKLVSSKEIRDLEYISIFKIDENTYEVFSQFNIVKEPLGITVNSISKEKIYTFDSMKNAICYCIFERQKKYGIANRIIELDRSISGLSVAIEIHKKLFKKSKITEEKLIYLAKLNEEKLKKHRMVLELDNFLKESNYWQIAQYKLKTE